MSNDWAEGDRTRPAHDSSRSRPSRLSMTLLVDIGCPDCGRNRTVEKRGLDRYYCTECDRAFTSEDVLS